MRLRCAVGAHRYGTIQHEHGRVFLQCEACGEQSHGVDVDGGRVREQWRNDRRSDRSAAAANLSVMAARATVNRERIAL
jgi:hypothetical protein